MSEENIPEVAPPAGAPAVELPMSQVDEEQLDLDARVADFFAPPTKPVGWSFSIAYVGAQFFLFFALLGPAIVSISYKAIAMFPDSSAQQTSAISMIAGVGAMGAVVANVVMGQVSDRTYSRWGRRRPWLVGGTLLMAVGLAMMGVLNTVPLVALGWLIAQIGANASLAPFVAVMSDQVPEFQRGRISSWVAIAQNVGVLAATYFSDLLINHLTALFVIPAIPAVLSMLWLAVVTPDKQMPIRLPKMTFVDLLKTFWVSPVQHPDYALVWWGRFLIIFSSYSFTTYRVMYLIHRIDLTKEEAAGIVVISTLIYTLVSMAASFAGGWLSDKFHRRKIFVFVASALFGVGTALLAHTHTVGMFYVVEAVMGLAYGLYVAVDLALVVDVLPDPEHAGKDLGVFNIANALPQSLAPFVAPFFLAIGSAAKTNYPALCYIAGACAIIGGILVFFVRKVR